MVIALVLLAGVVVVNEINSSPVRNHTEFIGECSQFFDVIPCLI